MEEYETMLSLARDGDPEAIILYILPEEREGRRAYRKKLIGSFSGKYIMNGVYGQAIEGGAKEYKKMYDMGVRYILIDYWSEKEFAIQEAFAEEIYVGRQIKLYRLSNIL